MNPSTSESPQNPNRLFVASVLALVAMAFGFIIRAFLVPEWRTIFNLTESQIGSIQGAGLAPQGVMILIFSLIVDRIGYGRIIAFAFVAHVVSAIITITATGFYGLYWGTFIFALAGGAIEGAVNPITATIYPRNKTHYLNMLHAGWPGGMVLGGLLVIALSKFNLGPEAWKWKVALYLIPVSIYGVMMLGQKFPVQERVAAGVSYMDMLREFGWASCLLLSLFIPFAINEVVGASWGRPLSMPWMVAIATLPTLFFIWRIRRFGQPVFVFLLVVMILVATTEIGTDSWISDLMTPVLKNLGDDAGKWVLIYTSAIMFVLRFCAGPIAHRLSPLGLLALCAAIACGGLLWLSHVSPVLIAVFAAATCYGFGKTFFWPTMVGVVSEQFPKGGALTISAVAGMGMISCGVLGIPFLGTVQDKYLDQHLAAKNPALHEKVTEAAQSKYGMTYQPLDKDKIAALSEAEKEEITQVRIANNQATLGKVAVLPAIMFLCYLGLILYFRSRGGYKQVHVGEPGGV